MNQSPSRTSGIVAGGLMLAGMVLLVWWVVSVTAYGAEVDERGLAPMFRLDHVMLFASSVACIVAGCLLPVFRRWALRRRMQ